MSWTWGSQRRSGSLRTETYGQEDVGEEEHLEDGLWAELRDEGAQALGRRLSRSEAEVDGGNDVVGDEEPGHDKAEEGHAGLHAVDDAPAGVCRDDTASEGGDGVGTDAGAQEEADGSPSNGL